MTQSTPSESRVLASALLVSLASFIQATSVGINAVVFPTSLASYGASNTVIGLILGIEFVSVFATSFGLVRMLRITSLYSWLLLSTLIRLPALLMLSYVIGINDWFIWVLVHGTGSVMFGTLLQTWINSLQTTGSRGLSIGVFGTSLSLGLAAGPVLLNLIEHLGPFLDAVAMPVDNWFGAWMGFTPDSSITHETRRALLLSGVLSTLAVVPVVVGRFLAPSFGRIHRGSLIEAIQCAPAAMFAVSVSAVSIFGMQSFITVYGLRNGLTFKDASLLLSAFMVGAITLEIPLAWLSDFIDRRYLIIALVLLLLITAVYMPIAIYDPWGARVLCFVWGGVSGGLFSVCTALISDRFRGEEQVAANGAMSVMDALGAMLGIFAIGFSMDLFDVDGLPYVIMLTCVLYFSFALTRYRVR